MSDIVAICGSPRRSGNTATLLNQAVEGAQEAGAEVQKIMLRDLKMSPCLEIYGCKTDGRCAIKDDFQQVYDACLAAKGLMLASPIFFYSVSAQTKIMMDRFQSLWVKKYWIDKTPFGQKQFTRQGIFISAAATNGKKLFDGTLLSVKYFMDILDMELTESVLCRGLDFEGDVDKHPELLEQARQAGINLAEGLKKAKA